MQTCLCLTPPPSFVYTAHTQICAHVKDSISICRKRGRPPHSQWYGHTKILHTAGNQLGMGSATVAAGFPWGNRPEFPMGEIPIGKTKLKIRDQGH